MRLENFPVIIEKKMFSVVLNYFEFYRIDAISEDDSLERINFEESNSPAFSSEI